MLCFQSQRDYKFKLSLLDDRKFQFNYKGFQKCQQLMEDTAKLLNLKEIEYFGFRFIDTDKQTQWINLNRNVQSQFKCLSDESHSNESVEISVYFGVKFYATDPCKLNDESTRYMFYLQLRKDIFQGRLPVQFDYAVDLFGYFLQGELGDYSASRDKQGYASEFEFIPDQSIELEKAAEIKHSKLKGMPCSICETNFLNKVKWLDMYGVEMQHVLDENKTDHSIGITPTGIVVYENGTKKNSYFWPRICKLNFKLNKFILTVIERENEEKLHVFFLANKKQCKLLWTNCVEHHKYFRMKTVYEKPAKLRTNLITSKQQKTSENSPKIFIKRVPAKRKNRRQMDDEPVINQINNLNLRDNVKIENNNLVFLPITNDKRLFDSSESDNLAKKPISPEAISVKSLSSQKYSKKRESASENEFGIKRRSGSRNRSRNRRSYVQDKEKETDSDNHHKKMLPHAHENEQNERSSCQQRRRSHHRSNSRGSTKTSHPEWSSLVQSKSRKSLTDHNSGANLLKNETRKKFHETSDHETTMDEENLNEMERKRQIRRRKRSKSPGGTTKPPEEILQHIKYNLVEPSEQLSADQLKEIPFVKIETKAPAFRISPHQKHKRYSPFKRKSCDVSDYKGNFIYLRDGTAQIVKTKRIIDYGEHHSDQGTSKPVTVGSAVNTKLKQMSDNTATNIAFSDSGCEDMANR